MTIYRMIFIRETDWINLVNPFSFTKLLKPPEIIKKVSSIPMFYEVLRYSEYTPNTYFDLSLLA